MKNERPLSAFLVPARKGLLTTSRALYTFSSMAKRNEFSVRFPPPMVEAINRRRGELQAKAPKGTKFRNSDAIRNLVELGFASLGDLEDEEKRLGDGWSPKELRLIRKKLEDILGGGSITERLREVAAAINDK